MANKNHSITNTSIYADSIKEIRHDVELLCAHGLVKTPCRIPKALVTRIDRGRDREADLQEVKNGVALALNDYCLIGHWSEGVDEGGKYIQFYLEPEKVKGDA